MIIVNSMADIIPLMDTVESMWTYRPDKPIGKYLRGAMPPHYPMPAITHKWQDFFAATYCIGLIKEMFTDWGRYVNHD